MLEFSVHGIFAKKGGGILSGGGPYLTLLRVVSIFEKLRGRPLWKNGNGGTLGGRPPGVAVLPLLEKPKGTPSWKKEKRGTVAGRPIIDGHSSTGGIRGATGDRGLCGKTERKESTLGGRPAGLAVLPTREKPEAFVERWEAKDTWRSAG